MFTVSSATASESRRVAPRAGHSASVRTIRTGRSRRRHTDAGKEVEKQVYPCRALPARYLDVEETSVTSIGATHTQATAAQTRQQRTEEAPAAPALEHEVIAPTPQMTYEPCEFDRVAHHLAVDREHVVDGGISGKRASVRCAAHHVDARPWKRLAERHDRGRDQQGVREPDVPADEQHAMEGAQIHRRPAGCVGLRRAKRPKVHRLSPRSIRLPMSMVMDVTTLAGTSTKA
jgi:hypothetical protein